MIDAGISQLEKEAGSQGRLDLVAISHFDHDHISGICRLISKFRIATLILPYMTLAERLLVAFEEGLGPNDDLMDFFFRPVMYLTSRDGPGIEQIVVVPSSGSEGPPIEGDSTRRQSAEDSAVDIDEGHDRLLSDDDFSQPSTSTPLHKVKELRRGGAIRVRGLWEFVPYNDYAEDEIPESFRQCVETERKNLLQEGSHPERRRALGELKTLYTAQFGDSSEKRNAISLFLYAGPICQNECASNLRSVDMHCYAENEEQRHALLWREVSRECLKRVQCSICYSGDGYLDTADRLQQLVGYLSKERVRRIGVFQVMHHGSENNWHKGVAKVIAPLFSVFSSDPARKQWGHPHAAVLCDFWPYGPTQVDKLRSVTIEGSIRTE